MLSGGCYYAIVPPANDQAAIAVARSACETAGLQGFKEAKAQQWHQCKDTRLNVKFRLPETAVAEFPAVGSAIVTVEVSDPEGAQHRIDCYSQTNVVIMAPSSSYCYLPP